MKYVARIDDRTFTAETIDAGHVAVGTASLHVERDAAGGVIVHDDHAASRAFVTTESAGKYVVSIENFRIAVSVVRESVHRAYELLHIGERRAADGVCAIAAPMPGLVRTILVEPGQSVDAGAVLLILEAMKMENEVRAPNAGVVQSIHVTAGVGIEKGRLLVNLLI